MLTETNITEKKVVDILIARAKLSGELAPRAIVVSRTVVNPKRSITREVRIALVTSINNEKLISALEDECVLNNMMFYFVGSETNLQGDVEVDYLFFETKVMRQGA